MVRMYKAALKPCPFCGNAEQTVFGTDLVNDDWKWNVECDGCHMQTKYYDSEKEKIIINKPELSLSLGMYHKYKEVAPQKLELAYYTLQQIEERKKEEKAAKKAAKEAKKTAK